MEEINAVVDSSGTNKRIEGTLEMLTDKLQKTISHSAESKLEIRTLKKSFPTHTLIIVDPDSDHKEMQIEPYPYGTPQEHRRVMKISHDKSHQSLFKVYQNSFNTLWSKGSHYSPDSPL